MQHVVINPIGAALYSVQRAVTTIDAILKIGPIISDIKEQAINIITKLAERANVRLNGKTITSQHAATRDSLSHNIGKIAATTLMNFINCKVTFSILNWIPIQMS
ncbi:hypothetical protein REIP_1628 [Rickettsia endosymbiont of Ixodes pacificus]|uniref:hypothetical protein n=1 Tax=Rickettsia endosymbiont of Ixodes pacificus TaxID=1133329 RepID=UPI0005F8544A|nr:hypothetical protein [Rickettsia endosymbiont of Ixodes pacificus]KJW03594.1 hypothetical protein REIP_1628 [Rickettsia endosymbiont of Ixodes pacificus]